MKLFRFALNIWITIASVVSFLIGWAVLAHSPKPVQPSTSQSPVVNVTPLPTLTPLQNFQFGGDNNQPNFQVQAPPPVQNIMPQPLFQTGGS